MPFKASRNVTKKNYSCHVICKKRIDSSLPLFKSFNVLTFQNIYKLFCYLLAYKSIKNNYTHNTFLIPIHGYETRDSNVNIILPQAHYTIILKSFLYNVPSLWNSLPRDVKLLSKTPSNTILQFKKKVKTLLFTSQFSI